MNTDEEEQFGSLNPCFIGVNPWLKYSDNFPGPPKRAPGLAPVCSPSGQHLRAVDEHVFHPNRILMRLIERRTVCQWWLDQTPPHRQTSLP